MQIRALQAVHQPQIERFVARIPSGERAFIDSFLLLPSTVQNWTQMGRARRFGAFEDDDLIGTVAVVPRLGWMSHVGELRLLVDPAHRKRGLAQQLVERGVAAATELKLRKLSVEIMAPLERVIVMFEELGFNREASLPDHVLDGTGKAQNLVILGRTV
jgi:GNAT superfamily N-acetyltransferase